MMPRALAMAMLILPPLLALLGGGLFIALAMRFRKGFGAIHDLPPGGKAMIAVLLLVHAGYLAAPLLHAAHKSALALWLTSPVAILATLGLILAASIGSRASETPWIAVGAVIAIALYWAPIAALVWSRWITAGRTRSSAG